GCPFCCCTSTRTSCTTCIRLFRDIAWAASSTRRRTRSDCGRGSAAHARCRARSSCSTTASRPAPTSERDMRPDPLTCALFLTVAFIAAGIAHSLWLRTALSRRLLIPLDGGLRVRGRRLFGENKTVRGFVVMVPAAAVAFAVLDVVLTRAAPAVGAGLWPLSLTGYAALGA